VTGLGIAGTNAALVGAGLVENSEERLTLFALLVVRLPGGFIPDLLDVVIDVIVGFGVVGAVVAGFPQEFGIELQPLWFSCL
jgi:hypothetical protein